MEIEDRKKIVVDRFGFEENEIKMQRMKQRIPPSVASKIDEFQRNTKGKNVVNNNNDENNTKQESADEKKYRLRLENIRTEKWIVMLNSIDWSNAKMYSLLADNRKRITLFFQGKDYNLIQKLKERILKGIPEGLRGRSWFLLSGAQFLVKDNKNLYQQMLEKIKQELSISNAEEENNNTEETVHDITERIKRDLSRTFPYHIQFRSENGQGQIDMLSILSAYAAYDRVVGYCQGMGFIGALLLCYMGPENAFYVFVRLMQEKPWKMSELFAPGMEGSIKLLDDHMLLIKKHCPKVFNHFDKRNIIPNMYATNWFLTIFSYSFPFALCVRIWDIFLADGWRIVHCTALAIIVMNEKILLTLDDEEILAYFRVLPAIIDTDELLNTSLNLYLQGINVPELSKSGKSKST